MTKYTEQFKLSIVQQYLAGAVGIRSVARQSGLPRSTLRSWVAWYRVHGEDGIKKKFSHYSAEFKLLVLQHMWDNELSYTRTAAVFNVRDPSFIGTWERTYRDGGIAALQPRPRGRPRKMATPAKPSTPPSPDDEKRSREELLAELNYLRMENAYLKKLKALVQAQRQAAPAKKRK
jgi:transposase